MNGSQLKNAIRQAGISPEQFSKRADISLDSLKDYCRPSRKVPRPIEELVQRLGDEKDLLLKNCRDYLQDFHAQHFSRANLTALGANLPSLGVDMLRGRSILSSHHEDQELEAELTPRKHTRSQTGEWDEWCANLWTRCESFSKGKDVEKRTLIMGNPGMGKTTILKLLLQGAWKHKITPLILPLSAFNSSHFKSIVDALESHYVNGLNWEGPAEFRWFIEKEMSECRILLLADALDEVKPNLRNDVITSLSAFKYPLVLTSRYTSPRIDEEGFTPQLWHLSGLTKDGIQEHVVLIRDRTEKDTPAYANLTELHNFLVHTDSISDQRDIELYPLHVTPAPESAIRMYYMENEKSDSQENNLRRFSTHQDQESVRLSKTFLDARSQWKRSRQQLLSLLRTPMVLNLYLQDCISLGFHHATVTSIFEGYIRLLIGRWQHIRSLNPMAPPNTNQFERVIWQFLSFAATDIMFTEHVGLSCQKEELIERACEHLRPRRSSKLATDSNDGLDQGLASLKRLIEEAFDLLQGAGLIKVGSVSQTLMDNNMVSFAAPQELLASYCSSKFIELAELAKRSPAFNQQGNTNAALLSLMRPEKIASHPNLRFLKDSLVFYLQSYAERSSNLADDIDYSIREIFALSPLDANLLDATEAELKEVMPTNVILAGRVLTPIPMHTEFEALAREVGAEAQRIYRVTNFEHVFESLHPIYRALRALNPRNDDAPEENVFDRLDWQWRRAKDCAELIRVAEDAKQKLADKKKKYLIWRRIIYKLRYHSCTFSRDALDFLNRFVSEFQHESTEQVGGVGDSMVLLCLNSLLMIRDNLRETTENKPIFNDISKEINKLILELRYSFHTATESLTEAVGRLRKKSAANDIVEELILNEGFSLTVMRSHSGPLYQLLERINDEMETLISKLSILIDQYQKNTISQVKPDYQTVDREARILFLLRAIASRRFRNQQYFMPEEYKLQFPKADWPAVKAYDPKNLLKVLFNGARQGIPTATDKERLLKANSDARAVGGYQLYDYYVRALWSILNFVPSAAPYEEAI